MRFTDKIAIITGASAGIGKATASLLAAEGAQTVLNARGRERLDAASREIDRRGKPPLLVAGDVSQPRVARALVEEALGRFGRIDILINNAGGGSASNRLDQISEDEWDTMMGGNLKSAFLCSQAVAPGMRAQRWGRIVNVSSIAGRNVSRLSGPHYSSAKAGMLGLTRHLARDLGAYGITVNAVAPGPILVPRVVEKWSTRSEADRRDILSAIPLGRLGEPEEVASVIAFLASDEARYVTGVTIDVNGGAFMA